MLNRQYTLIDKILISANSGLATLFSDLQSTRPIPEAQESVLSPEEKKQSAALMRVNHSGEVCAQALYHGQWCVARSHSIQLLLEQAAAEEKDHLAWTHQRIKELNSHRSYLNPFWYVGAFVIGMGAGLAGDRWSLGFVEETEHQVGKHLEGHLKHLSSQDFKSRKIIEQMCLDESQHGHSAHQAGAEELPGIVKTLMKWHAKVMTTMAYWV